MMIVCLKPDITFTCPGILTAVLPCLAYDDEDRRTVREMAVTVNSAQMKLVRSETEVIQYSHQQCASYMFGSRCKAASV